MARPAKGIYCPPTTVSELVERYALGERKFPNTMLTDGVVEAALPGVDLSGSTLRVLFSDSDLTGAVFRDADLAFTHFDGTLVNADFEGADLTWADFGWSNLSLANLRGTNITNAKFASGLLDEVTLDGATLNGTSMLDVSLVAACTAAGLSHEGPSFVDHRSIARSVREPRLKDFLVRIGTPTALAESMVKQAADFAGGESASLFGSVFISYGGPDEPFARKLNEMLHRNGVTTFCFAEHAVPGDRLHRMMRRGVNEHDRVVLVCSRRSLDRPGVLNEIEETLAREARDGGESYLLPIRLDDYVFTGWRPPHADTARAVRSRVVSDFRGAMKDDDKFHNGVRRLVTALRRDKERRLPRKSTRHQIARGSKRSR